MILSLDRPTNYKPRHSHSTQFLFVCFFLNYKQTNKNAEPLQDCTMGSYKS